MSSEQYDLMVLESDVPGRGGQGDPGLEDPEHKARRHAVCSRVGDANPLLEPEEIAMHWSIFVLLAGLTGLSAFGLVNGFALAEASFLFLAILVLSTLWLLSSWGEHAGSRERGA
jgi:hypothetical protein